MNEQEMQRTISKATETIAEAGLVIEKLTQQNQTETAYYQEILYQQQTLLDVLFDFQKSRWPWVRWVAQRIHDEARFRIASNTPTRTGVHHRSVAEASPS